MKCILLSAVGVTVALAVVLGLGCHLLVDFKPEGQPCSTVAQTEAEKCLDGYSCIDGGCHALPDGGQGGASGAGR